MEDDMAVEVICPACFRESLMTGLWARIGSIYQCPHCGAKRVIHYEEGVESSGSVYLERPPFWRQLIGS